MGENGETADETRTIGPPDRAARLALYRRRHGRELQRLQSTAVAWGAVLAVLTAALLVWAGGPGTAASLVVGAVAGSLMAGLLWRQRLDAYDRRMTAPHRLEDLPEFDDLVFRWAGPDDVPMLDAALDGAVVEANHWSEQDRTDHLLSTFIPGVVAGSFSWVVRDRSTGDLVGAVSCSDDPTEWGVVSIGLWLTADERGQGRGVEVLERAVPTVLALLRSYGPAFRGDPDQLTLSTDAANTAMLRTAERAGGEQAGTYVLEYADGTTARSVRFRFRAGAPAGMRTPAQERRHRRRRTESRALAAAAVVLLLVAWGSWRSRQDDRAQHRREVWDDVLTAKVLGDPQTAAMAASILDDPAPTPSFDASPPYEGYDPHEPPEPGATGATTTIPRREEVIDGGTLDDVGYRVTWGRDAIGNDVRVTVEAPGEEPDSDAIDDLGYDGGIESVTVPVAGGTYVLAWVPAITKAVVYEVDGQDPVSIAPIDLTERGGEPDTPLLVAALLRSGAADATLTTVDARGNRSEIPLS